MKRSYRLTQEAVDAASPRSREYVIMDASCEGLALRVRPHGEDSDQIAVDSTTLLPGELRFFLIRAENSCGGSLGPGVDDLERNGVSCP